MSISSEKMIERKEIMDGNILHVTVDTVRINGTDRTSTREVVWHKGACAIMPISLCRRYGHDGNPGRKNRPGR